ncbi:hypothetical protein KSP39_PZI021346 [Platanthera zijinensis]|uniref:BAG domain-containing protein n=1 Tax=Platanthera zijinensis TaxID=2320716 RepID=A0AAP0FW14_9ASPA
MPSDHHYHHHSHRPSNNPSCCSSCCRCCNCSSSSPLPPSLSGDQLLQYLATDLLKIQSLLKPQQIRSQTHHDTQSLLHALLRRVTAVESSLAQLSSHSPPPSSSRRPLSPPPPSTSHPIPSLREVAARTIQARFRRFLVRRSQTLGYLKRLASIKSNVASLRSSISGDSGAEPEALSRKTMDLLLQLDSIQSSDPMIRDGKRAISRELTGILDFLEKVLVRQRRLSLRAMEIREGAAPPLPRPRSAKKVSFREHGGRIDEEEKDGVSRVLEEQVFAFGNGTYSHGQSDGFGLSAPLPLQMEPRLDIMLIACGTIQVNMCCCADCLLFVLVQLFDS